jgi:ATP adenylyltransferase
MGVLGRYGTAALRCSDVAEANGALIPLDTALEGLARCEPFVIRRLESATPKHLRREGPKPNPFLPWDQRLEVERLGSSHLLLLNKFPVQRGHLLLITQQWRPQAGWLEQADWRQLAAVDACTSGLWFFNSCPEAGASQPHRHLQLLPREPSEVCCPLDSAIRAQLAGLEDPWPWRYRVSHRTAPAGAEAAVELERLYLEQTESLGLGQPSMSEHPGAPYNVLISPDWFMTVARTREHAAGFSVNALGFAGYLLLTNGSDRDWLERHGPLELLRTVAQPR